MITTIFKNTIPWLGEKMNVSIDWLCL